MKDEQLCERDADCPGQKADHSFATSLYDAKTLWHPSFLASFGVSGTAPQFHSNNLDQVNFTHNNVLHPQQ